MPNHFITACTEGIQQAVRSGHEILRKGGTAVEAVEKAVSSLEDNRNFNAGHGAVLNEKGEVECDAMIMDGASMDTGAVMTVRHFSNPVSLAKRVMTETPHCALNTQGALSFARKIGFPILDDPMELVTEQAKMKGNAYSKFHTAVHCHIGGRSTEECHDTVGAVAMDANGHLACATSTGGLPAKMQGRIGDSSLVGCGGYANEYAGCSTTGHGESLMKMTLAREAVYNIENGDNAQVSAEKAIARMEKRIDGHGGLIVIDREGNFGKAFNTKKMAWATIKDNVLKYGFISDECNTVYVD